MNLHSLRLPIVVSLSSFNPKATKEDTNNSHKILKRVNSGAPNKLITKFLLPDSPEPVTKPCLCGRRHFIGAATLGTTRFPIQPARATNSDSDDYTVIPSLYKKIDFQFLQKLLLTSSNAFFVCRICLINFTHPNLIGMRSYMLGF